MEYRQSVAVSIGRCISRAPRARAPCALLLPRTRRDRFLSCPCQTLHVCARASHFLSERSSIPQIPLLGFVGNFEIDAGSPGRFYASSAAAAAAPTAATATTGAVDTSMRASIAALIVVLAAGKLGDALAPVLLDRQHALLLIAMNANDMNLLVSHRLCSGSWSWWIVGCIRRLAEDGFFFWLGRTHGMGIVHALKVDVRGAQRWLSRIWLVALVLLPGASVCVAAGVARACPLRFLAADTTATLVRMAVLRSGGALIERAMEPAMLWMRQHLGMSMACTILFALLGSGPIWSAARRMSTARSGGKGVEEGAGARSVGLRERERETERLRESW